jgi:hypothetical protein
MLYAMTAIGPEGNSPLRIRTFAVEGEAGSHRERGQFATRYERVS